MRNQILKDEPKIIQGFLLCGIVLRIALFIFNLIVGGHNCDEVMMSLNGAALAQQLTDINGEHLPVYFDTWVIGGQSPLPTYITALFVKLFGFTPFAVRLPSLLLSLLGFLAVYGFSKEVFKSGGYHLAFTGLAAISPWMLFSGAYALDCNYLPHIMSLAFFLLAKAVQSNKTRLYLAASVCFGLCFYCYIASVLLIPFILISIYAILLFKKKISVKNAAFSVAAVAVTALPFLLWGLVVTKIIPEFTLLGFRFSTMPGYIRANDTLFSAENPLKAAQGLLTNVLSAMLLLLFNDLSIAAPAPNTFLYGSLLSGIIGMLGFIKIVLSILKRKNGLTFSVKLFATGSLCGIIAFCALVNDAHLGSLYRYGVLTYLILFVEAIGVEELFRLLKRKSFKRFTAIYLALSFTLFAGTVAFVYVPQAKTTAQAVSDQESYGDAFFDALDFTEEKGFDNVVIYKTPMTALNTAAYERYYLFGKKDFYSIEEEIRGTNAHIDKNGYKKITADGSLVYTDWEENTPLNADCCIVKAKVANKLKYDKKLYHTKRFGFWTVIYKE